MKSAEDKTNKLTLDEKKEPHPFGERGPGTKSLFLGMRNPPQFFSFPPLLGVTRT